VQCSASEDGQACVNCDYEVTGPDGGKSSGKTDDDGNFALPLDAPGTYSVSLLKNGTVIKTILVQSLPLSTPDTGKPTAGGSPDLTLLWLALLLALIIVGIVLWKRKQAK
jgi:LPXTG-motif cell wall-anchored protein